MQIRTKNDGLKNSSDPSLEEDRFMVVSVQFHGLHRMLTHTSEIQVLVGKNAQVRDVMLHVSDCFPDLQLREGRVFVLVNNQLSSMSHPLNANDKITFLPPVGGG